MFLSYKALRKHELSLTDITLQYTTFAFSGGNAEISKHERVIKLLHVFQLFLFHNF